MGPASRWESFTPSFRSMSSIKHQRVNPDCRRLRPTNAVNNSHHGLTQCASARLRRIKEPAIIRIHRSILIVILLEKESFHDTSIVPWLRGLLVQRFLAVSGFII